MARRGDKVAELEGRVIVTLDMDGLDGLEAVQAQRIAIGDPTGDAKDQERRSVDGNQHRCRVDSEGRS